MKPLLILPCLALLINSCQPKPALWNGPKLTQPRNQLTAQHLQRSDTLSLVDMSYYSKPAWAGKAIHQFSGSVSVKDTKLIYSKDRESYAGENIFPAITLNFIAHDGELIPIQKDIMITRNQSESFWDVIVGTGAVWQEEEDGEWSRASFPLTLTDRYVGQARNCVASFIYKPGAISNVCVQCSQETASLEDHRVGNIRAMLQAEYNPKRYADSAQVIEQHHQFKLRKLPVYPLNEIDTNHEVAYYFEKSLYTNAPTSMGAILMNEKLYLHPPKTRQGIYPYPHDMRHGVYSVTKSMAGALALMYFAQRYNADIFNALITDYVPALVNHPGWKGVTFSHTLNMVTGTVGSENMEHILDILIKARTAEESINNIATLGDAPEAPGEEFNYASTNLFVLSYALQHYVEKKEDKKICYWDLVHENVLVPIGAEYFTLRHTVESDGSKGIPILAYGAYPTLDEAAKIALLFSNNGNYKGQQLLHREKVREAFGLTKWAGYNVNNDKNYKHSFWSKSISTERCDISVTYMWGYGGNYVFFLPDNIIVFRFMDEYDLDFDDLIQRVERLKSSCR